MMKRYAVVPDLIEIQSNVNPIRRFSFSKYLDNKLQSTNNKVALSFKVMRSFSRDEGLSEKFCDFWGRKGIDRIFFEKPIIGRTKIKLLVEAFTSSPKIFVDSFYYQLMRFQYDKIYPPGLHLTNITIIKLLEEGYSPMHCASVSYDGKAILIFAPPTTGKTFAAISLLDHGFKILSEDIAIIDDQHVYGCPLTSTFEFLPSNVKLSKIRAVQAAITKRLSLHIPVRNIFELVDKSKIDKKARVKIICILDVGEPKLEKLTKEETMRRISILNRDEFSWYKDPLLLAYSYFNPSLDLNSLMIKEKAILS
ncbi:MAG TPA: hypothetical protein EYP60_06505, partial [bacterium (Candidatus Stahlbacteria)]|nr:hypothetical protein [Candidatus Stahlbacteria bacterium]